MKFHPLIMQYRRELIILLHLLLSVVVYFVAFWLRLDFSLVSPLYGSFQTTLPHVLVIKTAVFIFFNLHRGLWQYAGIHDLKRIIQACVVAAVLLTATIAIHPGFDGFPRSVILIDMALSILVFGGKRLSLRLFREMIEVRPAKDKPARRILIAGAGSAGLIALREISKQRQLNYRVVGFIDDDPYKDNMLVDGKRVLGKLAEAPEIIRALQVNELLIAMPSAPKKTCKQLVDSCRGLNIKIKTLPALTDLISGSLVASHIRDIQLEDLLGRDAVKLDRQAVVSQLRDKCVLVTGAGGSIGSEISRQVAACRPKLLILLDIAESPLFEIETEVRRQYPEQMIMVALADIKHIGQLDFILAHHKPEVIFHAAAFKHVPMLETHPLEAILNNILGTRNLAQAAIRHGVKKFLMISTDKAVRPTSIMGATKRCTEIMLQNMPREYGTDFFAVRFGNVLGSNGSVVPLFRKQIAAGGPVTITHKDITRYFMTIPEAVELVLQSLIISKGGETYLLEMGEPVKIIDLATELIELSGLVPGEDIEIVETGLRPGEKLFEELVAEGEDVQPTIIPKIKAHRSTPRNVTTIDREVDQLIKSALDRDEEAAKARLWALINQHDSTSGPTK